MLLGEGGMAHRPVTPGDQEEGLYIKTTGEVLTTLLIVASNHITTGRRKGSVQSCQSLASFTSVFLDNDSDIHNIINKISI